MHKSLIYSLLVATLYLLEATHAKAVFAHYMVGTVTEAHVQKDIDDAIAMGLDGFSLNVGDPTQAYVAKTLGHLFKHAAVKKFKLFLSMDLSASGAACAAGSQCCNGPLDYNIILGTYSPSPAYYLGPNGLPMISTFQSGGFDNNIYNAWKKGLASHMYFIPMFDETQGYYEAASGWWDHWGSLVDGLFSWEAAWPYLGDSNRSSIGSVEPDKPVMKGALAHNKDYMIALSTLQYKNAYNTNLYRPGETNLPMRMSNILALSPQPNFVEIITWNDGPESHYIGNIWPEMNTDVQPALYASHANWSHVAWQPLLTSFITAFKAGTPMAPPTNANAVGAIWYKTTLQTASCPHPATPPSGFSTGADTLNWAVILPTNSKGMRVRTTSGGTVLHVAEVTGGLTFGSAMGVRAGAQVLEVLNAEGRVVMATGTGGRCVKNGCPDGIWNMNYQVVGLAEATAEKWGCV